MNATNVELYDVLRYNLHLSDGKSKEFINIMDMEYKSGVKEDLKRLEKVMNEGFQKMDDRFQKVDDRFVSQTKRLNDIDLRLVKLDDKIDLKASEVRGDLRVEIRDSKVKIIQWVVGLFMALAMMILAGYLKK